MSCLLLASAPAYPVAALSPLLQRERSPRSASAGRGFFFRALPMAAEKCIRQLPPIRISDSLEMALMRMAASDDRSLSEFVRLVLERHAFGHASSLPRPIALGERGNASHGIADELGGGQ